MPGLDLALELVDQLVQFLEVFGRASNQLAERPWQLVARVIEEAGYLLGDVADALRNDETELAKQAANLVGLSYAGDDEALTRSMQRQHSTLFTGTNRMLGLVTASQMASASATSFLLLFT